MASESTSDQLSSEQLTQKLAEVLEGWPLYRKFAYRGKQGHHVNTRAVNSPRFGRLPPLLSLNCSNCKKPQFWETRDVEVYFGSTGFHERRYTCRNCGTASIWYFFAWRETAEGGLFVKVGQSPPLTHDPPKELAERFDQDDLDLYRKALDCRNFAYGVGALAYLRRVVENRTNDLLDLIAQAAREEGVPADRVAEIETVKRAVRYEDKLSVADKAIPSRLKREGFNPIGSLYKLASSGIHQESEDECLDIFDRARLAFEYLFSQLEHEKETAKAYVESLKALDEKAKGFKRSGG